jgi:hypothetical protein
MAVRASIMTVRASIMADSKGKNENRNKKIERFIPWAWGVVLITIIVLFVKNALAH